MATEMTMRALAVGAALSFLGAPALADKIYRTDGDEILDVTIVEETLTQVIYKEGNREANVPSGEILRVEFEKYPKEIDEAEAYLADGDPLGAVQVLDDYVDEQTSGGKERKKWAPAFAAWRAVEIRTRMGDLEGMESAASRLIKNFADSRYLPMAFLAKLSAQQQAGDDKKARQTVSEFAQLVSSKSLPERWQLESRLAQVRTDDALKPADQRDELITIAAEAGDEHPTVRSRAWLVEGETYLAEAEARAGDADQLRSEARKVFERITADPRADGETLAGAYTGLGDCAFYAEDPEEAAMNYLRVVVSHEGESRYVPKALFFAMRSFTLSGDRRRAADMYRTVQELYPSSPWSAEAQKFKP